MRSEEKSVTGKFLFHAICLVPRKSVMTYNHQKMFSLSEHEEWAQGINIQGGQVLEICLAKWWANLGTVKISYTGMSEFLVFYRMSQINRFSILQSHFMEYSLAPMNLFYMLRIVSIVLMSKVLYTTKKFH